ncbi:hypothetical protein HA402_003969 [Bradysia odoriphaga]|nr:hypothetical protein HA402_003969 [Bradysia odoriphaga]
MVQRHHYWTYTAGQIIDIDVDMTQYHRGFMEFRLRTSPGNGAGETQACFNQHLLRRADGGGSRTEVTRTGWYAMRYRLPANVCDVLAALFNGITEQVTTGVSVPMGVELLDADHKKHSEVVLMLQSIK